MAVASSECCGSPKLAVRTSLRARAPLVWFTCLPKTSLRPSASLVSRSRLVVPHTSRYSTRRHPSCPEDVTFLRLGLHFRVLPGIRVASMPLAHSLSEVSAPTTLPTRRDPPLPSFCLLGSCCVLALTMCLDAFLPRRAPWCPFNQARPRGSTLQSITRQRSWCPLGTTSPPAISFPTASTDTRPAFAFAPPRLAVIRRAHRTSPKACPSRMHGARRAFGA